MANRVDHSKSDRAWAAACKRAILKSLRNGASVRKAVKAAGCSRTTFYEWRQKDKRFNKRVLQTYEARTEVVEDALFMSATEPDEKGKTNVTAQIFWLCNRKPDSWKNVNKVEHSGPDGKPLEVVLKELSDFRKNLDKRRGA